MDPGDVLVADALDPVAAEAVVDDGGALQGLAHRQLHIGIALLQQVARAHGAGGAGGEGGGGQLLAGLLHGLEEFSESVAGDVVVPEGVAHLGELVEDHHGGILLELPGLVEDLLDVGLAAGGGDDLAGDGFQPVEALLGHVLGQDGHGVHGQELGVEGAAAAVVAGGGPDGVVIVGVKLAGDQAGHQAAVGGAHLVAARGEPLADEAEDAGLDAGQGAGQLDVVHAAELAAVHDGLVVPGDAEQVQGVHVPEAHVLQSFLHLIGDQLGVLHLLEGGQDDVVLAGDFDVSFQSFRMDGKIDHIRIPFRNNYAFQRGVFFCSSS